MLNVALATWQWSELWQFWPHVGAVLLTLLTLVASAHAVLHKRDTRAAIAWVGVIWLAPILGTLLYIWLGINRIRRKARVLRGDQTYALRREHQNVASDETIAGVLGDDTHLRELVRVGQKLTGRPLLAGNQLSPLVGGDQAYPVMLAAIEAAQQSISLCSYIFNNDPTGRRFADALARAVGRGVQVRVLVDDIGARYSLPSIIGYLRDAGVPVARFMPALVPVRFAYSNLRSHRKILVCDGRLGFTGGMNIRESADFKVKRVASIADVHFRVAGPVVAHLQQVFADDWEYSTGESLTGDTWFPGLEAAGDVLARGLSDGPDEDHDKLRMALLGALACAESRVQIITPYFLPDASLITSLNVAAMRGVQVDILLPRHNNLSLVQWASTALLWQVLEYGCRVWLVPPPFEHTKLMLVDRVWSLVGSGNWDPRSLRLNFEFNVECYDRRLAESLGRVLDEKQSRSQLLTPADVDSRPLPIKLRDGVARLLSPYL
ncbi:MAG TPA: cardiolipin synthase [Pirellulales bacterium]